MACYIWYSEEGPGRATSPSSPLLAIPNVTPHPSTASVPNSYYLMRHYNYLCTLKPGTHWQQSRTRHSGDKNHGALLTTSTELNKFNCGDNADRDKLSNLTSSPVCTDGRQSQNFMNINEDRLVEVTVACAASNHDRLRHRRFLAATAAVVETDAKITSSSAVILK